LKFLDQIDDNNYVLDKRTLARINDRPRGRGSAIYAALGIAAAVTVMAFLVS
jgi:hypothetical protein